MRCCNVDLSTSCFQMTVMFAEIGQREFILEKISDCLSKQSTPQRLSSVVEDKDDEGEPLTKFILVTGIAISVYPVTFCITVQINGLDI